MRNTRSIFVQTVTLGRIPLAVAFAVTVLAFDRHTATLTTAIVLLSLIELSDLLDGVLARRLNAVSEWGAMLDPYADSMARIIVYWALACEEFALAIVPLGMAFRDITVAYSRIVLVWHHRTVASNWSGKIKAWVQGAGAFFLLVLAPRSDEVREIISWAVFGVTLASGFEYVKAAVSCACLTSRSHGGGDASGQAGDKEWE